MGRAPSPVAASLQPPAAAAWSGTGSPPVRHSWAPPLLHTTQHYQVMPRPLHCPSHLLTWNEEAGQPFVMTHCQHILKGTELQCVPHLPSQSVLQVGHLLLHPQSISPHLHLPPRPHSQQTKLAHCHACCWAGRVVGVHWFEGANIPHLELGVHP